MTPTTRDEMRRLLKHARAASDGRRPGDALVVLDAALALLDREEPAQEWPEPAKGKETR